MGLLKKKKAEPYEEIQALIGHGTDYHVYHMTRKDRIVGFAVGAGGAFLVSWLFFHSVICSLAAMLAAGIGAQSVYRNYIMEKRKRNLLLQFKDLLESLTSSYSAGKNTLESFTDSLNDMTQIYGEEADIVKELETIVGGMNNNINVEELLINFAQRSGLDDVESFADVFRVAVRQGANIKDIIASTRDIITDKIEVEMEIHTMMAGNKNELNIMMIMPLVVIMSLGGMGSGMSAADNTPVNVIVKLIALGMFGLAYWLGRKFMNIKV